MIVRVPLEGLIQPSLRWRLHQMVRRDQVKLIERSTLPLRARRCAIDNRMRPCIRPVTSTLLFSVRIVLQRYLRNYFYWPTFGIFFLKDIGKSSKLRFAVLYISEFFLTRIIDFMENGTISRFYFSVLKCSPRSREL